ncbi:MAG TPA: hypothetical protein VNI20_01355 [Fimbriimonadaceae bacterium]|nr:hypothetical protein [Fimbriimonadaceae bacterium]
MIAALALLAASQQQVAQPLYDGAHDFASAIEKAAKDDPKFLDTIEPFATGYWLWRAESIKTYDGSFFANAMLECGTEISHWDEDLGKEIRKFALAAIVEDPNRLVPVILQSDIRMAYVDRLAAYSKDKDKEALFSAGSRLAGLTPYFAMAEFIELSDLKSGVQGPLNECTLFVDEQPKAPEELKALIGAIGKLGGQAPFGVHTMKQIGMLTAQALASQVPIGYRWKIPPG